MSNLVLTGQSCQLLLTNGSILNVVAILDSAALAGTLVLTLGPNSSPPAAGPVIQAVGTENQPIEGTAIDTASLVSGSSLWTIAPNTATVPSTPYPQFDLLGLDSQPIHLYAVPFSLL